ncbi:hypothetical protein V8D89_003489 [Ganoderma adspersum]
MAPFNQPPLQPRATVHTPLNGAKFDLDSSGIAGFLGFLGGDMAIRSMGTMFLFRGHKRRGGWYNMPGSFELAKRFWSLANEQAGLVELLRLGGKVGPKFLFLAPHSHSSIEHTGHIAALIMRMARNMKPVEKASPLERITLPTTVTVIDLPTVPECIVYPTLVNHYTACIGGCIGCALIRDWWSFSGILLGMFANGFASLVLSAGRLVLIRPESPPRTPPGDGVFVSNTDRDLVVVCGECNAVNFLTRGRFSLEYGEAHNADIRYLGTQPKRLWIGVCSTLLATQFLAQLLLILQGVLFGQIMFILTLVVSGLYNTYLSSISSDDVQVDIFCEVLRLDGVHCRKFEFGTWTTTVVFACLALHGEHHGPHPSNASSILNALIPYNSEVWTRWKTIINERLYYWKMYLRVPTAGILEAAVVIYRSTAGLRPFQLLFRFYQSAAVKTARTLWVTRRRCQRQLKSLVNSEALHRRVYTPSFNRKKSRREGNLDNLKGYFRFGSPLALHQDPRSGAFKAPLESAPIVSLNVLKMDNVMAIARGECSLFAANHGPENPLQGEFGFGWAGFPVPGDGYSDV